MKSPANVDQFLEQIKQIIEQRGKAVSLLFSDIEQDLNDKVRFLRRQSDGID
jgi:hypothetical protein